MMIKAKIKISGRNADLVAVPLTPDNTSTMNTVIEEGSAVTYFEAEKIGTLIASVDDYLMNAKVAEEMLLAVAEKAEAKAEAEGKRHNKRG